MLSKNSMDIQNKKILLVGGGSFIGHNLALYPKEKKCNSIHSR